MSDTGKKTAYIVVCWNNKAIINECLESINNQSYDDKVTYVIDNNSSDGSADFISKQFPGVKLIRSDKNNGFARGNNILIKEALKDPTIGYVALINSDAVIGENWTSEIVSYIEKKQRVAGAQGLTVDYYNHSIIDAEHVYVGDNFQSVQYGYSENVHDGYMAPRKVFGVNAAAALYTREFIEDQPKQQLFDEKFYMYLEDVDICFRAIITGWSNYFIPTAYAYHMGSVSSKKRSSGYNIEMTFRNQSALLFKNLPLGVFLRFLPRALRFERHFYTHLKQTSGKDISDQARRGRIKGLLRLGLYVGDRRRIQKKRIISNRQLERIMESKGIF